MRRTVFMLTTVALTVLSVRVLADPGDAFNAQAPSWDDAKVLVAGVRTGAAGAPPGPLFVEKSPTASPGSSWSGATAVNSSGFSSNAASASFGSPLTSRYISRSTNGSLIWADGSGAWATFGDPPGGTTSSPAAAGLPGFQAIVAVRGANNIPWYRIISNDGSLNNWVQIGNTPISSAPGVAMTTATGQLRMDVFALDGSGRIMMTTNTAGISFASWTEVPGGGAGISQPNATWVPATGGGAGPWLAIGVVGTDHRAYVNYLNTASGSWTGWNNRGFYCQTALALSPPTTISSEALISVLGPDNAYWVSATAASWASIGHP
jgi:hypothetical protein